MTDDLRTLVAQVALNDPAAVPGLRRMAAQLNVLADQMEAGWRSSGGMGDVCRLQVVGPDGTIKQTGGNA